MSTLQLRTDLPSSQKDNNIPTKTLNTPTNIPTLNIKDHLNIATHNIQGLNDPLKLQIWLEYCAKNNYHIVSITETKLKNSSFAELSNPLYKIYTSNFIPKENTQ